MQSFKTCLIKIRKQVFNLRCSLFTIAIAMRLSPPTPAEHFVSQDGSEE